MNKLENKRKELENKITKIKGILNPLNKNLSKIISELYYKIIKLFYN